MKIWNDNEVKSLFEEVERCKNDKKSLRNAFVAHAKKFERQPNSVRNYYYHEVDNLIADQARRKRLNIDLSCHEKSHFVGFNKVQEEELFEEIEKQTSQGKSVRSVCQEISGGDLVLMTRIQNKYQNMKRKIDKKNNVIPFKQKVLSENDINSLFLGLVKLIKKTAMEEAKENSASSNSLLKKVFADLDKKEKQILELKLEYERVKKENRLLIAKLEGDKTHALQQHLSKRMVGNEKDLDKESKRV